ncbi:MAG: xanthine dehydrogenase family protein subunit M [Acidobacteriaceae bacterium]|nr:xanthine dehydrogenase family protein subunit M [Acidobacteriaceae bacterium]
MSSFGYISPQTLEETIAVLGDHPESRLVAGGNDVLLPINHSRLIGSLLVDLRRVSALRGIERQTDGSVRVGAMTSIGAIASSALLRAEFPALAQAAELVGDAQVRNRATLGGSIAANDPEADLPAPLLALDASIEFLGSRGRWRVRASEFFRESAAGPHDEIIVSVVLPRPPEHAGMAYVKFKHPARLYALCGVATVLGTVNGQIDTVRVAVTGAANRPFRFKGIEDALLNRPATAQTVNAASSSVFPELDFRGDIFASTEYRSHLTAVLTRRALEQALAHPA